MRSHHARHRRCRSLAGFVIGLAGFGVAAFAAEPRTGDELRRELEAIERDLAALEPALQAAARLVPAEPETAALEARLLRFAEISGVELELRALDPGEIPALPDGSPGPVRLDRVELSGRAELGRIGALLSYIEAGVARLLDLESLDLVAVDGPARFTARLVSPTWTAATPAEGFAARGPRSLVAERRAEVERMRQRVAALEEWIARAKDGRLAVAADLIEALGELERTEITALRVDDRVELAGATLGVPAREALAAAIERTGLAVAAGATPEAGACRPFRFALAPPARAERWFSPAAGEIGPDPAATAICATDPAPSAGDVRANGDATRAGAFTLHARGLDLVDLFRLLHETTGAGFVIDPDVAGRVDADFEGVTLDEALAALGPLGLHLGPEPIRRVSRRPVTARQDDWTGEPTTLSFKRLGLDSLLCLFDRAFALPSRVAPDLAAEVSIFASEAPWDLALVRSLESAGLDYAIVDGVAHVAPPERLAQVGEVAWVASCEVTAEAAHPLESLPQPLGELGPDDFTLVATTESGDDRRAWAYGAFGRVHALWVGAELHGATVETIEPDGVGLRGADGRAHRLAFTP